MKRNDAAGHDRASKGRFHYPQDRVVDKMFNWSQLKRLLTYMKPYAKTLLPLAAAAMFIGTIIRLAAPVLIGYAIDEAITPGNGDLLIWIAAVLAAMYALQWVSNVFRIRWINRMGQHIIFDLRRDLFNHIQTLSHRFFDQRSAGSILVRVTNDVHSLQELFTNGVINLMMDVIMLVGIVSILFVISPELTTAVMIVLPIMFYISTNLRRRIRRSWQLVRLRQSTMNAHLNESIQGMRVTQAYHQEQENMRYFDDLNMDTYDAWEQATRKSAKFRPVVELSNAVGTAVLIWYGIHLIGSGALTIGNFVTFATFLGMFWEPISRLGQIYNQLLMAMASSERIFEYLDESPSVPEKKNAVSIGEMKGDVRFEQVSFQYDTSKYALKDLDLHIQPGETFALVGHTGSGKTTIVNLISRFYDPTGGNVLIDGRNLREVTLESLRSRVSVVLQDTFIFSGTIMDNIRFGNPDADDEEVKEAAFQVGADSFIRGLRDGYDTEVEERGNVLSVGERQLISFARALLADPRILILDEATASIDTETEQVIQEALRKLLKGRTAVMIAHRLSTIREADRIMVLKEGEVLEEGSHQELIRKQGEYNRLVKAQFQPSHAG
ncbi:ABC transporter ATP-binding protein [Salibacterium halotolerans]|uniref:Putative ABC transport system ATP-binding protein/ATP-binding cassette, subfamily B n=1 Tax=Salibacterium halotolerans TaxID=1884432 RepID=A0A1I5QW57_9BACI|nr:ABC transporter ATP-binding protein [Salibacterium halotolerans]SFP50317.1 putative ABC transport system ATP-binding protein/ATP-binding cassette, subfamily B [Salibacterium halotolerans]